MRLQRLNVFAPEFLDTGRSDIFCRLDRRNLPMAFAY